MSLNIDLLFARMEPDSCDAEKCDTIITMGKNVQAKMYKCFDVSE